MKKKQRQNDLTYLVLFVIQFDSNNYYILITDHYY